MQKNNDSLPEYDFNRGTRGKYAKDYHASSNIVKIDPSLAKKFPNEKAVNKALRAYAKISKA